MLGDKSVTIKALRWRGGIIEWNYDNPRQCAALWRDLCRTGCAPDTGDLLVSANYFTGASIEPRKSWERDATAVDGIVEDAANLLGV